eukprot:2316100-Rhodomonas_salina.1
MLSTGGLAAWDGNEWGLVGGSAVFGVVTTSLVNGTRLFIAGRFSDEGEQRPDWLSVSKCFAWVLCVAALICQGARVLSRPAQQPGALRRGGVAVDLRCQRRLRRDRGHRQRDGLLERRLVRRR